MPATRHTTVRLGEASKERLARLAPRYGGQTAAIEAALELADLDDLRYKQLRALILDLDMDATDIIIRAIAELWQREIGEPERDLAAELDELKAKIDALAAR